MDLHGTKFLIKIYYKIIASAKYNKYKDKSASTIR